MSWTPEALEASRELAEELGQIPTPLPVEVAGGRTMTVDEILEEHPELMRREAAVADYEANVFARHPEGFKVHFKVICKPGVVVGNLNRMIQALIEGGYEPDTYGNSPGGSQEAQQAVSSGVKCPDCGGPTERKTGTKNGRDWAGNFCINTKDKPREQRHK